MSPTAESTPLLQHRLRESQTSLAKGPWLQVGLLCPCPNTRWLVLLWHIADMLVYVGIPEPKIGFSAGLIESAYSVTECLFLLFFWTALSDRIGRKPVLVVCLAGITSTNVWQMLAARMCAGVFSGCIGMIRVMIGESCNEKDRAQAFAAYSSFGNISLLLAPLVGGLLARPAEKFGWFAKSRLFTIYPFLLPSMFMGVLGVLAAALGAAFIKKTLVKSGTSQSRPAKQDALHLLRNRKVVMVLIITTANVAIIFAWTALLSVFLYTSVTLGGLGLSISHVSGILGILWCTNTVMSMLGFSRVIASQGVAGTLRIIAAAACALFVMVPFCNIALRNHTMILFWPILVISGLLAAFIVLFFAAGALAVNDVSPTPEDFANVNSLSLVFGMALRTVAPVLASSVYATGVEGQMLRGHLGWAAMFAFAVVNLVVNAMVSEHLKERLTGPRWGDFGNG